MNNFLSYQEILEKISPRLINMPRIYLLGDTGTGKSTIIRKILGTDKFNFPTTRQTRTTVAPTEYVISKSLPNKATFIFKNENQIKGYIREILHEAVYKNYKGKQTDRKQIAVDLKQTSDQRFRLYYILSENSLEGISTRLLDLIPKLDLKVKELQKELPEDIEFCIDYALDDLKDKFQLIEKDIFIQIKEKVADVCNNYDLCSDVCYYQFDDKQVDQFILKCKLILSSEKNSISPVIDYARIQGNLLADWIDKDTELVLIDGEGIGHDTKEASQLSTRHYDYFYQSDAIVLVEESKRPFVASAKNALKSIFERGYGRKLLIIFSKLDEVVLYDIDDPSRDNKISEVNHSLDNVLSALKDEKVEININNENIFYLSEVNKSELDKETKNQFITIIDKTKELSSFKSPFIKPEYDFEMLSAYLIESKNKFINLYKNLLNNQHWQTIKAFNRRICWKIDGFRMFTPIADFEEKITDEVKEFISHPKGWSKDVTEKLKIESINQIKQEFNQLLLQFARQIIINIPTLDWKNTLSYCGMGSTDVRKRKIDEILNNAVPISKITEHAVRFKDEIKKLLIEAIKNCENKAKSVE
ncbi:TniB family NTP-binding protein [candidate division KSB1 bacterium]|nr:TniB family NTP-binding protein [candidate division KSB1 bacterium]